MSRPSNAASCLGALGVPAEPGSVYELALTHRSFAFENDQTEHNERLEFLGDAVLGLIVTDLIFRDYPTLAEGEMARLRASVVNTGALAEMARSMGLGRHIRLGKGEESSGGRNKSSLLADTYEALIGAVFVERGIEALSRVVVPLFSDLLARVMAAGGGHDPKTALQELVVRTRGARPVYRVASSGPDHDKRFVARVFVGNELRGAGSGRSKKQAEQAAARRALVSMEETTVPELAAEAAAAVAVEGEVGEGATGARAS